MSDTSSSRVMPMPLSLTVSVRAWLSGTSSISSTRILVEQRVLLERREPQLVEGVRRVRHELAKEDLLVRVERVNDDVEELAGLGLEGQGFGGGGHALYFTE